jgi:hypothetical protein
MGPHRPAKVVQDFKSYQMCYLDSSAISFLGSVGSPALIHAFQPPTRARALCHPARLNSCATRALVASFGQAQKAMSHASLSSLNSVAFLTASSG